MGKTVGVLAIQGDFEAHQRVLARVGMESKQVRTPEDLASVDAIVIPGGESSTMLKLLTETGMEEPLRRFGQQKPVFGTCAGAILVAAGVSNPMQESLRLVDIDVQRNAYGRQLDSRIVRISADTDKLPGGDMEAVFIRAPIIRRIGTAVKVLASYNGDPVLVEQGNHLVATFHPELSDDSRVHRLFVDKIKS